MREKVRRGVCDGADPIELCSYAINPYILMLIRKIELKLVLNWNIVAIMTPSSSHDSLYHHAVIHYKVCIPFSAITDFKCIEGHLNQVVSSEIDGRCIAEGFVKPDSCKLRSYSIGTFAAGNIRFDLDIECMMCCPKEGAIMKCIAKTVTQAGIRAHACATPSPVVIYVSREMHDASATRMIANHSASMDSVKPGDMIQVRVVGRRFELNDKYVSIIGEWSMDMAMV